MTNLHGSDFFFCNSIGRCGSKQEKPQKKENGEYSSNSKRNEDEKNEYREKRIVK